MLILLTSKVLFSAILADEKSYLNLKSLGRYNDAIEVLKNWTLKLSDPILIETNIFRINEILLYPELYDTGLGTLEKLKNNKHVKNNKFLISRIDEFRIILLLKKGKLMEAASLRNSLHFLKYNILGPFNYNSRDEYNSSNPGNLDFRNRTIFKGKYSSISWFKGTNDLTGSISLNNSLTDVRDSYFFLSSKLFVKHDGFYYFLLGRMGYTDIWLNGKKIYSGKKKHGFMHGQYYIKVHLSRGRHDLFIKTGNYKNIIRLSLRVTDIKGRSIDTSPGDSPGSKEKGSGRLIKSKYFFSLDSLISKKKFSDELLFRTGYLFFISNLTGSSNTNPVKYFSRIKKDNFLQSHSFYYLSINEKNINKKENLLKESLDKNKNNLESLVKIIKIRLDNNFYYEAFPLIQRIKKIDKKSFFYYLELARFYQYRGWDYDAVKIAEKLINSKYPSTGHLIKAKIYIEKEKFSKALKNLKIMNRLDRYNINYFNLLVKHLLITGNYDKAKNILTGGITKYPDYVEIPLQLSTISENQAGPRSSLPYLSSAFGISPYNKKVILKLGITYYKINRMKLAKYYLNMALLHDPDNYSLKRYLQIIFKKKNEISRFLYQANIQKLIKKSMRFNNESAIIFLDETGIRINSDSSYEKYIHRIIKINNRSSISRFKNQYITIDPGTEKIENLKCYVINEGIKTEITERFRRSLSDPVSRLYYDLEAVIIPIPSLRKGSIIDISYKIINKGGKEYKNYFGEKIIIGDEFRTLVSNVVISYPGNKKINVFKKHLPGKKIISEKKLNKNIYRLTILDRPPFKNENAMPHENNFLPIIYLTSFKSWGQLYTWYRSLLKNRIKLSIEMKNSLKKLISPGDSEIEKVKKIYNHVTGEIRYVGFELGIGGIQPRHTDLTYNSKMGDCKDISLLLVAMLKEFNIDAKLALIRTRDKGKANLVAPFIGEFNHAICYVKIDEENQGPVTFFLDGTVKNTGFKELPDEVRDTMAMVIGTNDFRFVSTKSNFYDENKQVVNTEVRIKGDGSAIISRKLKNYGNFASESRPGLKNLKKKIISLGRYWNNEFPGSKIENLKILNRDINKPVSYRYTIKSKNFAYHGEKEIIFKSFIFHSDIYKNFALNKKRISPVVFIGKSKINMSIKYYIPEGYRIYYIPKNKKIYNKNFNAGFNYIFNKKYIKVTSAININNYYINKKDYREFRKFARFINRKEHEKIVLVKD